MNVRCRIPIPLVMFALVALKASAQGPPSSATGARLGEDWLGQFTPGDSAKFRYMAYDSALVRRLAGNYRIARDRVISMGPMDEAGGWLAFFDSKTRRGGILRALSDTAFVAGATFGIEYPFAILADVAAGFAGGNGVPGLARPFAWTIT